MDWPINRRQVLLGSGMLLTNVPAQAAREALKIPQGAGQLSAEWLAAPSLPLWEGPPPGAPKLAPTKSATLDPTFITG